MGDHPGPGGGRAAARGLGQHPGRRSAGPAQPQGSLPAQQGAQQEQPLRRQFPAHGAGQGSPRPEGQREDAAPVPEGGGKPGAVRHPAAWPHRHPLQENGVLSGRRAVGEHRPLVEHRAGPGLRAGGQHRAVQGGAAPRLRPQQGGALHQRPAAHGGALLQHRVGAQQAPLPHPDIGAQVAGGHHLHPGGKGRGAPHPGGRPGDVPAQAEPAGQGVGQRVQIGGGIGDLPPGPLRGRAAEGLPFLQQGGKEALQGPVRPLRQGVQSPGREHAGTGVRLAGQQPAGRVGQQPLHPALLVGENQGPPGGGRAAGQQQGGGGGPHPVEGQGRAQIPIPHRPAREHQHVLLAGEVPAAARQGGGAQWLPPGEPGEAHPQLPAVSQGVRHQPGQPGQYHPDLPHAAAAEMLGLAGQQRLSEQGEQAPGLLQGQGGQPLLPLPGQDDRFQGWETSFHTQFPLLLPECPSCDTI